MIRIEKWIRIGLMIFMFGAAAYLVNDTLQGGSPGGPAEAGTHPIAFIGSYNIDGGPFQAYGTDSVIKAEGADSTVVLRGHFSEDIPDGQFLMMRISFLDVTISVKGEPVFCYDRYGMLPPFSQSGGTLMYTYQEHGIKHTDQVEIVLHTANSFNVPGRCALFLETLQYGTVEALYAELLAGGYLFKFICGILILSTGILCFAAGCSMRNISQHLRRRLFLFSAMTIFGGLWFVADYRFISLLNLSVAVHENLISIFSLVMWGFMVYYVRTFMKTRLCKKILLLVGDCSLFLYGVAFLNQAIQVGHVIDYTSQFINMVMGSFLVFIGACVWEYYRQRNREALILFATLLPVIVVAAIDGAYIFIDAGQIYVRENLTCYGLLLFVLANIIYMIYAIDQSVKELREAQAMESEYAQARVAMMLSQIRPHFLYNVLTLIRTLCREDASKAVEAVTSLACYLRGNMDSLSGEKIIPFQREFSHLQQYLSLEKIRFEDRLQVVFDIQYTDFYLPALTLQPLVENAIRHGLMQREEGGIIFISTVQIGQHIRILVEDNGLGFIPADLTEEQGHIGLSNTRQRIALLCKGNLVVHSQPGKGTEVTIYLPKEGNHENHCC